MIALLFDVESTGLIDNHVIPLDRQPSIIEWYSCLANLDTGEVLSELDLLIRPPTPVSAEITKITHITNEMLTDKPSFIEAAPQIMSAVLGAPLVIAHNCSFDVEMAQLEFERIGLNLVWPPLLCTVEQTVHLKGFRLSLTALHEHLFGEPFPEAHRAKSDTQALLRCAVELHKRNEI